jgi:hypothetical protein
MEKFLRTKDITQIVPASLRAFGVPPSLILREEKGRHER